MEIQQLVEYEINGRQIKNAVKVAASLASYQGDRLSFEHLMRTLKTMKELRSAKVIRRTTALERARTKFRNISHLFKNTDS